MKLPEAIEIAALDAVEIAVEPWIWPFAQARVDNSTRHNAGRGRERRQMPAGRNGKIRGENGGATESKMYHAQRFC
jgi:hypothetical protein